MARNRKGADVLDDTPVNLVAERQQHRMKEFESSLSAEIKRRNDLEDWLTQQVNVQVQLGLTRAADNIEERLLIKLRQHISETKDITIPLETEIGTIKRRLGIIEGVSKYSVGFSSNALAALPAGSQDRLGAEKGLSWLEDRVLWLERRLDNPTKDFPVEVASQLQVIRTKLVDECTSRFNRGFSELQTGFDELRSEWRRSNIGFRMLLPLRSFL